MQWNIRKRFVETKYIDIYIFIDYVAQEKKKLVDNYN
jgi:hypothetical protein